MKTILHPILAALFLLITGMATLSAQSPDRFNYQAVIRDAGGAILTNRTIGVRISIHMGSPTGNTVFTETHSGTTNQFGLVSFEIGGGTGVNNLKNISWDSGPYFLKIEADPAGGTNYAELGTSQLVSVPYALYADDSEPQQLILDGDNLAISGGNSVKLPGGMTFSPWTNDGDTAIYRFSGNIGVGTSTPTGKLEVQGDGDETDDDALFEVKRKDGQPVFSVYPTGVRVFVEDLPGKGSKGGFAVGGFSPTKGATNDYLWVTPDSVRIYIDEGLVKGSKGGFAVGGLSKAKGSLNDFMRITHDNYFIGQESGASITTGLYNSFMGYQSGRMTTTGERNIFLGYRSGFGNQGGGFNTFIGNNAGYTNTEGGSNVFIGDSCGYNNNGDWNIFIGNLAGYSNTTGWANVAVGDRAGLSNENGEQNVFIGDNAGRFNTSGSYNVMIGAAAGLNNKGGNLNLFLGYYTGSSNISGNGNVFLGDVCGFSNEDGISNVFLGTSAGYSNISGNYNVFLGTLSGKSNTLGEQNIFIGQEAGFSNQEGNYNIAIGTACGHSNVSGLSNVFLGQNAGFSNVSGSYNVALGTLAGSASTGSNNVFVGQESGRNNTGSNNTMIGFGSGFSASAGSNNIFIGTGAGYYATGYNGKISNMLMIDNKGGTYDQSFMYGELDGFYLFCNANLEAEGSVWATEYYYTSDAKYKTNIQPYRNALDKVARLNSVSYDWIPDENKKGRFPEGTQIGLIAQEVEEILPEIVHTDRSGDKAISYAKLTAVLIEAMKEQQTLIENLQQEVKDLRAAMER